MRAVGLLNDASLHLMNNSTPTQSEPLPNKVARLVYTKAELTQALGLSSITIHRLEQRGLLNPVQGVRHKLFALAEVDRFLSRRAQT